jgi:hypothetical protein
MKSNRQTIKNGETVNLPYLDIPEKAFERFNDPDFVKKYISPDVKVENVYYLSGETNHMGTAIYYITNLGDYVYYNHYSIGEKLFPIGKFCKYQKAISAELAKNPNDNGGGDVDISGVMDLSEFELKEITASSENLNSNAIGEDSLSISEEIKEHFRVYETYSDENTKPELRLVKDFKSIMRYYNVPIRFVFSEYDNIDDIPASIYKADKYYVVEQQDGTLQCYDEYLKELKSNRQIEKNGEMIDLPYLDIPEKAFERFNDPDFVKKYISPDVKVENVYYLSGESNHMGTAIYYRTNLGDYVYYNHYSIGEKLFPIEKFCKYQKAISAELANNPNDNGSDDIDISGVMDLSEFELKETAVSENVKGDANCDGELSMADAVLIMQSIANPEKYGTDGTNENHISEQGKKNADITGDNDGITNADALTIQKKLLKLD